jgi:hypothetical protein
MTQEEMIIRAAFAAAFGRVAAGSVTERNHEAVRLDAVRLLLKANGCDCDRSGPYLELCLPCRALAVISSPPWRY